jgi:outer membrane protein OmpA-like peptidoglycan-associated protein
MLRAITILIILCCTFKISAQNLVANGSFSERNICTEYRAICAPEAWFFIPTYVKSSVKEDSNYFEILSVGWASPSVEGRRNYIYTKLLCPLRPGKQYNFTILITTARNNFDHLEAWFGEYEPGRKLPGFAITEPSFTITRQHEEKSKEKWKKYRYVYTAKGGEKFLMLGNLSSKGMEKSRLRGFSKNEPVLYGIDDVALTGIDTAEQTCPEYKAVLKQVYDQNNRHPAGLIEDIKIPKPAIAADTVARKKQIIWVIVDTPPSLRKTLNDTLTIPDVLFHFNSSKLNQAFIKDLDKILEKLKQKPFKGLEVTGHTDNKGTSAYNLQLSEARANAIKNYLVARLKLDPETVSIKGIGEALPVATNETAEGRQRNRRVEIIVKH